MSSSEREQRASASVRAQRGGASVRDGGRTALRATYRLQLGGDFGFEQAAELVPYLRRLGVSHLYLSPSLQARSGSTHGYDVVDPTSVSEALGGERALRQLASCGLPIILDVVPNHMGTGDENRWWADERLRERFFDLYPGGGHRRFFDIDDMAAIRQEREEVFETTHGKILELVRDGVLDGLRVDHPDGLADPAGYLARLRQRGVARVWVEKILSCSHPPEPLRDWEVTGTVGYEFLGDACALYVDPAAREPFTQLLAEVTGDSRSFADVALEAQLEQAHGPFARDLERLRELGPFDERTLAEGLARLPIYRTYVEPWSGRVEDADREAVARAGISGELARALLLDRGDEPDAKVRHARDGGAGEAGAGGPPGATPLDELVTRFQQLSPAIDAKGVEDTAFYRYLRLLCLNEVGGDPDRFGMSVERFHAGNAIRAKRFPEALLTTQTHDTKRSGDARARLGALSSIPAEWREHVLRWLELGEPLRSDDGAPDRAEQYLIHQTLIGIWPVEGGWSQSHGARLEDYLVKALRERKLSSSWIEPDERWELEVLRFARELLASERFRADFDPFAERVALAGERAALGQTLLKLTSPGVPDIFQGDELWRLSLVDPDNRRAVDWARRERLLAELERGAAPRRETAKLHLIREALALRARRPESFVGAYEPLPAGPDVCAYLRGADVLCVVEIDRAGTPAGEAELEGGLTGRWRNVLDGEEHDLGRTRGVRELTGERGLALLERAQRCGERGMRGRGHRARRAAAPRLHPATR
ncbi:MAG: alpha-amylase family glycosyl hydrolase [Solirubrobacteraceae bacterium]